MEASFNIKFVGEVEKYPELYNYKLQAYSKRDATEKAWNNVAKEVNLSVNECKEKLRNLRSTFVKNLKPKPSGALATKKKTYYLMKAMQFAIPFVKVAGYPTGNLSESSQVSSLPTSAPDVYDTYNMEGRGRDFTEALFDDPGITSPPAPSPSVISSQSPLVSRVSTPTSLITTETRGPHGLPTRRRKSVQSDAADKAFTAYLSAKQAKLSMPPPVKDEKDKREEGIKSFVMSLIPELMQFNDVQLRIFKRKALLLIDETVSSDRVIVLQSNNQVLPSNKQDLDEDLTQIPNQYPPSFFNEVTGNFSRLKQSSLQEDSSQSCSMIVHL